MVPRVGTCQAQGEPRRGAEPTSQSQACLGYRRRGGGSLAPPHPALLVTPPPALLSAVTARPCVLCLPGLGAWASPSPWLQSWANGGEAGPAGHHLGAAPQWPKPPGGGSARTVRVGTGHWLRSLCLPPSSPGVAFEAPPILLPLAGLAIVAGAPGRTLQIPENPPGAQPCAPRATGGVPEQRDLRGEGSVGVWVTHKQWWASAVPTNPVVQLLLGGGRLAAQLSSWMCEFT